MDYAALEDAIVTRLQPIADAGHEVENIPSIPSDNKGMGHTGRITVQAGISKFDQENLLSTSATTVQDEYLYVEVIIRSKRLRTNGSAIGIYPLAELARQLLQGWTPPNCELPFVCVDFGGIDPAELTGGVWSYSLRLKTKTTSLGTPDSVSQTLINQITFLDGASASAMTPTVELYASAYSVTTAGDQITLAWVSSNADEVEIDNGIGVVSAVGNQSVTISANTTYTVTATTGNTSVTASVTVTIGIACDPVTEQINGVTIGTAASGTTNNQVVQDTQGNSVGTAANPSVIAKSTININGIDEDAVDAEQTFNLLVKLNGVNSGTYDSGTKTVNVTATIPNVTIGCFSDAGLTNPITSADFGDTVYFAISATGITATNYRFFLGNTTFELTEQGTSSLAHTIDSFSDVVVYAEADDSSDIGASLDPFTLTINSDADANAFIAAHNALSGQSMGSIQEQAVQGLFQRLKGANTTYGSDIWSIATANANSRLFPLVPVNDSTATFASYALDALTLNSGTYNNFISGDISVDGVTGGGTKYFDIGVAPNAMPQDAVSAHYYSRTNVEGNYRDFGASDAAGFSTKQFSITANRSGQYRMDLNANLTLTNIAGASDTRGFYSGVRSASNLSTLYKDGAFIANTTTASTTPTASNLYFHSHNQGGSLFQSSIRQLSFYALLPVLTANEVADLYELVQWFQTNVITGGRDV